MYWRQKGQLSINSQQRRDNLVTGITNYLADKNTTSKRVEPNDLDGWWITIVVDYVNQADSDQVWSDVQSYVGSGWIVTGWMGYSQHNDDDSWTPIGRLDMGR